MADAVGTAVATTGRPESINELYAAYDRLTPADLQRVAAQYFQPDQRDGDHPGDGDQEMTTDRLQAQFAAVLILARRRRDRRFARIERSPTRPGGRRRPASDAVALAIQPAGRLSRRASAPARRTTRRARRASPP